MGTYKNVNATVRYLLDFEAVPYNQKILGHPMVLKDLEKRPGPCPGLERLSTICPFSNPRPFSIVWERRVPHVPSPCDGKPSSSRAPGSCHIHMHTKPRAAVGHPHPLVAEGPFLQAIL